MALETRIVMTGTPAKSQIYIDDDGGILASFDHGAGTIHAAFSDPNRSRLTLALWKHPLFRALPMTARAVFIEMDLHQEANPHKALSAVEIAGMVGCRKRQAQAHLEDLRQIGLVTIFAEGGSPRGGKRKETLYLAVKSELPEQVWQPSAEAATHAENCTGQAQTHAENCMGQTGDPCRKLHGSEPRAQKELYTLVNKPPRRGGGGGGGIDTTTTTPLTPRTHAENCMGLPVWATRISQDEAAVLFDGLEKFGVLDGMVDDVFAAAIRSVDSALSRYPGSPAEFVYGAIKHFGPTTDVHRREMGGHRIKGILIHRLTERGVRPERLPKPAAKLETAARIEMPEEEARSPLQNALFALAGEQRYDQWFSRNKVIFQAESDSLRAICTNDFYADWIRSKFAQELKTAAMQVFGRPMNVTVVTQPACLPRPESPHQGADREAADGIPAVRNASRSLQGGTS